MAIDRDWTAHSEPALLRAEILRAYRRCTNARQRGEDLLAQIAEEEMNRLLDLLPRPRSPIDDAPSPEENPG